MNLNKLSSINYFKKIIINTGLLLFFLGLIAWFIILPSMNEIKRLRGEIIALKVEMEQRISQDRNLTALNEKLRQIEPKVDKLDSIFINQNRELEFITTLEGIAARHQVKQTLNLMLDEAINELQFKAIPLKIQASGSYSALTGYLIDLEKLNYYINIENFQLGPGRSSSTLLSRGQDGPPAVNYNLSFTAMSYWK